VLVHDFDLFRAGSCPDETHAPLPFDADAVLADAIVFQRFQLVARWRAQELKRMCGVELGRVAVGYILDGAEPPLIGTLEQRLRILAVKALDRGSSVLRLA
jgi:hypothetical protein